MSGKPQEYRQHAENCRRLAETATSELKKQLLDMAARWDDMAAESESLLTLLHAVDTARDKGRDLP
jgi:hypothetical protein